MVMVMVMVVVMAMVMGCWCCDGDADADADGDTYFDNRCRIRANDLVEICIVSCRTERSFMR